MHKLEIDELRDSVIDKKSKLQREYKRLLQIQGLQDVSHQNNQVDLQALEVRLQT